MLGSKSCVTELLGDPGRMRISEEKALFVGVERLKGALALYAINRDGHGTIVRNYWLGMPGHKYSTIVAHDNHLLSSGFCLGDVELPKPASALPAGYSEDCSQQPTRLPH